MHMVFRTVGQVRKCFPNSGWLARFQFWVDGKKCAFHGPSRAGKDEAEADRRAVAASMAQASLSSRVRTAGIHIRDAFLEWGWGLTSRYWRFCRPPARPPDLKNGILLSKFQDGTKMMQYIPFGFGAYRSHLAPFRRHLGPFLRSSGPPWGHSGAIYKTGNVINRRAPLVDDVGAVLGPP